MTLKSFFELLAANPAILIFFFIACPMTALLAWWLGRGENLRRVVDLGQVRLEQTLFKICYSRIVV